MDTSKILLVEDTLSSFARCKELLGDPYEVWRARNPNEAYSLLEKMKSISELPAVVILDLGLVSGPADGMALLCKLKKDYPALPIIVWTKHKERYGEKALKEGAAAVIEKHFEDKTLEGTIRFHLKNTNGAENE